MPKRPVYPQRLVYKRPSFILSEMLFSHLRLSVPQQPVNHLPNPLFSPIFEHVVEFVQFQSSARCSNYHVSLMKNTSPSFGSVGFRGPNSFRAMHLNVDVGEITDVGNYSEQNTGEYLSEERISIEEIRFDGYTSSAENIGSEDFKERERKRKIGLANKGKVPWNKGKKHSAETIERIRQRTKEAMQDPKVRKKMSECPRAHSNQTKARIRSSLKQLWGERLKWKRSREKFLQLWAESIAKAAKKGGSDQQELEWDSYDMIKREIALQQLQWAVEKVKAKEMAQIRAQRAAQDKAEKMERLVQKRKEREQNAIVRGERKRRTHKKSKEEKEGLAIAEEQKLKARLTKIHRKKSLNGQVMSLDHRSWEKFDLEFMKSEQVWKEVSLAEQIRAAKNRRAETAQEVRKTSSYLARYQQINHLLQPET